MEITKRTSVGQLNISFEDIVAVTFALRGIIYVWLAFNSKEYMPILYYAMQVVRLGTPFIGIAYIVQRRIINARDLFDFIPLIILTLFQVFHNYDPAAPSFVWHELLAISAFIMMGDDMKGKIFSVFYKIILYTTAASIVLYVLYLVKAPIGFTTVTYYTESLQGKGYYYIKWLFFANVYTPEGLIRMCGIFNEPGGLGTVAALLFAATYKYSKKWEKIVLVIGIALSLSVGGIVLLGLFFVLLFFLKRDKKKIAVAAFAVIALIIVTNIEWNNAAINLLMSRLSFSEGVLAGDNRANIFLQSAYNTFLSSNSKLWGMGMGYASGTGSSSYLIYVIQMGFLGFSIYAATWLIMGIKHARKNEFAIIMLILFMASVYQRPVTILNTYGYVVLLGGMAWINKNENILHGCDDQVGGFE